MKIAKRGNIWYGKWTIEGKRYRVSSNTSDEKLAREYLAQKYSESFKTQRLGDEVRRTWEDATKKYQREHSKIRKKRNQSSASDFWTAEFKTRKIVYLDEIIPEKVEEIVESEMARPKQRGGGKRTPADVNKKIVYLRSVMNAAHREWMWFTGKEPPRYRLLDGEVERMRYLQPSQVVILCHALGAFWGTLAKFAVATGLRRANVLNLRWTEVDLGRRLLTIDGWKMKNGAPLCIPLNQMAVQVLQSQLNKSEVWVFPYKGDKPAKEVPSKVWKRALQQTGFTDLRWHDLRHTWASIARQNGVPLDVLQELGGWKTPDIVQRYGHLDVSHLESYAGVIDQAFGTNLAQSPLVAVA